MESSVELDVPIELKDLKKPSISVQKSVDSSVTFQKASMPKWKLFKKEDGRYSVRGPPQSVEPSSPPHAGIVSKSL